MISPSLNGERTKQKIAEIEALRSQTRFWRVASALAIIAIVIICVSVVVNSARALFREGPPREEFTTALIEGLNERVLPPAKEIASQTLNELTPVVQEEFKKLNQRTPELVEALQKESAALMDDLPKRADKVVDKIFNDLVKRREAKIKKLFPNLTDEKVSVLIENLIEQGGISIASLIDELFKPHEDTLNAIVEDLYDIQELERDNIKDDIPTWDMAILLFDLIKEDLDDLNSQEYVESLPQALPEVLK